MWLLELVQRLCDMQYSANCIALCWVCIRHGAGPSIKCEAGDHRVSVETCNEGVNRLALSRFGMLLNDHTPMQYIPSS
jgi:hypothetical protein